MKKDLRIAQAVGELAEAFEFVLHLSGVETEQAREEVKERYPEFIERFEAMKNVDEGDFKNQFVFWALNKRFRENNPDIWEEVKDAFSRSSTAQRIDNDFFRRSAMRQIDEILNESDFP